MVPPAVVIANIAVGSIANAINLCKALIDRHDVKQDVKVSCHRLKEKLISCQEKADKLNNYISQYRDPEVWKDSVSEINGSLTSIEVRLQELLSQKGARGNVFAAPRRKFRQPYDMEKKLSALIKEVDYVDLKIFSFQMHNNVHTEANATSISNTDHTAESQLQESGVDEEPRNTPASVPHATPTRLETATPDVSRQNASLIETTTVYSLVSDFARVCTDLVVYSSKALIALGDGALLRVQEALVARAMADCADCLRLLGNKTWYFCGSNTLPAFVVKMALINQPDAARRKIVEMLLSLSRFGMPKVILEFRPNNMWVAATMMNVSFVNALIFKDHFRYRHGPSGQGKAAFANDIISELKISASDMLFVLQTMRQRYFADRGLVIVLNREQGLGWYRVLFDGVDGLEQSSGASGFRLEYMCRLEIPGGVTNSRPDMKDIMILNFLHTTKIPPEARELQEHNEREFSYMETSLRNEGNMSEGDHAILDAVNVDGVEGVAYTELLEIACIHNLRASYHARCQSYVDSLAENVNERQLVVSNAGWNRHTLIRQGREISFELLAEELGMSVMRDAKKGKLASSVELYEYGRFCAQREVWESWYDLLVSTVANKLNVNFAQASLTGRGSYTKFVAKNMSVRLTDSILLCDPASDSIAVAFDEVSELSNSLKVRISELMKTSESERLRAAFFICRGAVRTRRSISTRMLDVMRSRYMGLEGIGRISAQDVTEDLDEGDLRNPGVFVECMESLAMQGGYRESSCEMSLFAALCSSRECEKTIVVTGIWPSLFGNFFILQDGSLYMVQLDNSSKVAIEASRHADIYRAQRICQVPVSTGPTSQFTLSKEIVCVQ